MGGGESDKSAQSSLYITYKYNNPDNRINSWTSEKVDDSFFVRIMDRTIVTVMY